jgi:hypothetical protein
MAMNLQCIAREKTFGSASFPSYAKEMESDRINDTAFATTCVESGLMLFLHGTMLKTKYCATSTFEQ